LSARTGCDDGLDALRMSSITYRIATCAQAGRKVTTPQTIPADADAPEGDAGTIGGFLLHEKSWTHLPRVSTSVRQTQGAARQSPSDRAALADGQARRKAGRVAAPGGAWSRSGFRLGSCSSVSRGAVNWPHRPDRT